MLDISTEEKVRALQELAIKRRQDRRLDYRKKYRDISEFLDGYYDRGWVSPASNSAHNVDADWMLVLQDWDSEGGIPEIAPDEFPKGYNPDLPTNKNLTACVAGIGVERQDMFVTNLFPFIKPGSMSGRIPVADLNLAAMDYCLPQIRVVRPRAVICAGLATFNGLRRANKMKPARRMVDAIDAPFALNFDGEPVEVWCQAHPGFWGVRNRGGLEVVKQDWARMANTVLGGG